MPINNPRQVNETNVLLPQTSFVLDTLLTSLVTLLPYLILPMIKGIVEKLDPNKVHQIHSFLDQIDQFLATIDTIKSQGQ